MLKLIRALTQSWTWRMAWRDSRSSRRRLLLFSSSITLGVAALVAIGSLGRSMQRTVDGQARSLLGADLVLSSRQAFSSEAEDLFTSFGAETSRETSFSSMIVFEKDQSTRLIQARALEGAFPWYGMLETEPPTAAQEFRSGAGVLLEESLAIQFDARKGDLVRLGNLTTRILGILKKVPGDTVAFSTIAPRVYFAASTLPQTGLVREGSLARYRILFRFPEGADVDELVQSNDQTFTRLRLNSDTVSKRKADLGNSLGNFQRYLNLAAFIALLLGAVGIASAIHVHVTQKLSHVGVLRCLGVSLSGTFAIYLAQALALGCLGVLGGILIGAAIERLLPRIVQGFIPFEIASGFSWRAAAEAAAAGLTICVLFALLPLLQVRRVSPLAAIRVAFEPSAASKRRTDVLRWLVLGLIGIAVAGFGVSQTRKWWEGLAFTGGLLLAFGILAGAAQLLVWLTRRLVPSGMPFVWRQGLANLHRPNNRTTLLILALGLGTFLILTLQLVRDTVLKQLFPPGKTAQPNAILFDIQQDQRDAVAKALKEQGLAVLEEAPILTMRLASVKGRPTDQLLADKTSRPSWALRREYRSTWRTQLGGGEELVGGTFVGSVPEGTTPIPVSLEDGIARELGVTLGDELVFDVQGVLLTNRITSLRKVDWRQVRPNFFVVFPAGVLEAAPVMHVMATHVASADESARMQREIVRLFPNVSAIDLTLVLRTLDDILSRVGLVVRFMALFTVATGLIVLVGAVLTGRWQRVQEGILLRTLGATRSQIQRILFAEYLFLGMLAAITGAGLAVVASWALAVFAFKAPFSPSIAPLLWAVGGVTSLTVVIGLLASRGVCDQPPLEILRREA